MKLRRLLVLAGMAGAVAVPATAGAQAQTFPPGPGPVLFCGATVRDCVVWAESLFSCNLPVCPPAPAPAPPVTATRE
jgi:hypothetical protein